MLSQGAKSAVIAQLGAIIVKRNLRLGEVIASWGDVEHKEFRTHVRALGVHAENSGETFGPSA